jgi:hypothetical protein
MYCFLGSAGAFNLGGNVVLCWFSFHVTLKSYSLFHIESIQRPLIFDLKISNALI